MSDIYTLCVNPGSSSYKFKLFSKRKAIFFCEIKNHSEDQFCLDIVFKDVKEIKNISQLEFSKPVEYLSKLVIDYLQIELSKVLGLIIFRVVHGGEKFDKPVEIDKDNLDLIRRLGSMSPLHSPKVISAIEESVALFPNTQSYAVFDTSFHLTNPRENFLYALPYGYYENLGVRRFGFHGIAYANVLRKVADIANFGFNSKIICCHLGSGSSVCAIKDGKSVNHSFGFTPDENLIMATRSGEVDYDAIAFLKEKLLLSDSDVTKLLNQESGLIGVSGMSKDMKFLIDNYDKFDRAKLAVDMYVNKVIEFLAKFYLELQGVDLITFSGGIGFHSFVIRNMIIQKLNILGIKLDQAKNERELDEDVKLIESEDSICKIAVVKVDEEDEMMRQVMELKG